jgi:hypothetical protein
LDARFEVLGGLLGVVGQELLRDRPDDHVTPRSPRDEDEDRGEQRDAADHGRLHSWTRPRSTV